MKKFSLYFIVLILAVGCELPKSITFTDSPILELPGGISSRELSAFWDIKAELDTIAADIDGLVRVDTQPGDPYRLEYNHEIINISISDYYSLDFDTINQTIDPQYIDIPTFAIDPQTISENIDSIAIPADLTLDPFNIPGIPEIDGTSTHFRDIISDSSSVTFDTGTMNVHITIAEDVVTPGLVIDLTSAEILAMDDSLIAATATVLPINLTTHPTITFPLAGITIPSDFKIEITLDITNGGGGAEVFDLNVNFDITPDTTISSASGIDFEESELFSMIIPFDPGTEFVSTIIGTGQVDITLDFPPTWTNITWNIDMTLFQNSVPITSGSGSPPCTFDLSGVAINTGDITVQYEITVTGTNASFALDPESDEITGGITSSITNLATLVISPAANIDFSQSITNPIDPEVFNIIESITFSNPVITSSIINDLPFDINISLDSPELEIDPALVNHTIPASGTVDIWTQAFLTTSSNVLTLSSPSITDDNEINIELIVTIPGYDSGTNELTLYNIVPGTSYSLSGSVSTDLTINQFVIAATTINKTFPDTTAGEAPLDFSMFTNFLPGTTELTDMETILDISLDNSIAPFSMYLAAHYTNPHTGLPAIDDLLGTSVLPVIIETSESLSIEGLQSIFNIYPDDLIFECEITTSGATVNVTGTEEDIAANLNISIPLNLHSNGDSELLDENGNPIIPPPEEDIFGREGDDDFFLLDYIDSVILHTDILNNTGIDFRIDIESTDFFLNVSCSTSSQEIELTHEQMETIINTIPFNPAIHLILLDGNHRILTDSTFELTTWFEIKTNVEYTIDLGWEK